MTRNRFAFIATVLLFAASLHAQQPASTTRVPAAPPTPGNPPATTPVVQTVPNALQAVDTETLGPIENAGTLRIRSGSGTVVTMQAGITRVAVGDDKLLSVHVLEPREILLQGITSGRSTLFVWLADHRRLRYDVVVVPKVDVLRSSLRELDPGIEAELSADGTAIVLRGDVPSQQVAQEAERITQNVAGTEVRIVNFLKYPEAGAASEAALTAAVESVDPRIHVRRIQMGTKEGGLTDSIVLEGRVRTLAALVRAMTLADLQLGGGSGKIQPMNDDERGGGSGAGSGLGGGGAMGGLGGGIGGGLGGGIPGGTLSTYVARGLVLKLGRVISFLEVDELPQIQVSIRALQVNRGKARQLGIDWRLDTKHLSIGSFQNPSSSGAGGTGFGGSTGRVGGGTGSGTTGAAGAGNILATFVDQTVAISAAINVLEAKQVARSVAEPNITTLSGEVASVLVGGSVPIPTTTVGNVTAVQGFNFTSFGVRLEIRPTLAPNGIIALELAPSIVRPNGVIGVGGVPGFDVQTVSTNARVAPGQSLILGGLLSFDDANERRGIPGLSSIPIVKHFFSWEGRSQDATELVFVITPRVLSEPVVDGALAATSNIDPLPYGKAPVLPSVTLEQAIIPVTAPPPANKPTGLPADFPLAPTVAPQPDVLVQPNTAPPAVVLPINNTTIQSGGTSGPTSTMVVGGTATTVAPMHVPVTNVQTMTIAPPVESTTTTTTTTTTAPTDAVTAQPPATTPPPRPAPQAPKQELPPPPSPTNPN